MARPQFGHLKPESVRAIIKSPALVCLWREKGGLNAGGPLYEDEISAIVRGGDGPEVVRLARALAEALQWVLNVLGFTLSPEKCKKFLMHILKGALQLFRRGNLQTRWLEKMEK